MTIVNRRKHCAPSQRPQPPLLHRRRSRLRLPDPEPPLRRVLRQGRPRPARRRRDRRLRARSLAARSRIAGSTSSSPRRVCRIRAQSVHGAGAKGVVEDAGADQRACCGTIIRSCATTRSCASARWCRWRMSNCICRFAVSGYTDFYSSKEHATNVGVMFRGKDNALQPNWLHMPIGYNGRASTVVVSGTQGAAAARAVEAADGGGAELRAVQAARFRARNGRGGRPAVGDGRDADREAGRRNDLRLRASSTTGARATSSNGNMCRSGRSRPRRSRTSISPWVVTREALEPFRVHGPAQDPKPLPYLQQAQPNNYDMAARRRLARGAR